MSVTWRNSLEKLVFFSWGEGVLCGIQTLKIIYMSNLGKVLESLKKKIQNFQRFKIFRYFRVFIPSYRANLKSRKRRKT